MENAFNKKEEKKKLLNEFYSSNQLMEKLFNKKSTEKKNCENERVIHPLFMKADKCFVVYRSPLSPYITEKVIIFSKKK